ncbi:MAG: ATP-binding protein, partial [Thermoanaerobaculia bacterium]
KFSWNRERPRVEIGAREDGDQVLCHVRDNGVGIAPRYHENIFGLFNQLDQQREGTGIGLALIKRIVEIHGGRIWVESQPDQGATFWFTLPRPGTALPPS